MCYNVYTTPDLLKKIIIANWMLSTILFKNMFLFKRSCRISETICIKTEENARKGKRAHDDSKHKDFCIIKYY